jgi:hypothetical protein
MCVWVHQIDHLRLLPDALNRRNVALSSSSVLWRVEPTDVETRLAEADPEMAMAVPQPRSTLACSGRSSSASIAASGHVTSPVPDMAE